MRLIKALLSAALIWCALAVPALAAWSVTPQTAIVTVGSVHTITRNGINAAANALIAVGGVARTASSADSIICTDSNSQSLAVHQWASTGSTPISWFAQEVTTGLTSGSVSCTDTATGGTVFNGAAMTVFVITGNRTTSPEDTGVFNQVNVTPATTTPTITSGAPSLAGGLVIGMYGYAATSSGFSATEDPAWTGTFGTGNTVVLEICSYIVNATGSAVSHTLTTNSHTANMSVIGFLPPAVTATGKLLSHPSP